MEKDKLDLDKPICSECGLNNVEIVGQDCEECKNPSPDKIFVEKVLKELGLA